MIFPFDKLKKIFFLRYQRKCRYFKYTVICWRIQPQSKVKAFLCLAFIRNKKYLSVDISDQLLEFQLFYFFLSFCNLFVKNNGSTLGIFYFSDEFIRFITFWGCLNSSLESIRYNVKTYNAAREKEGSVRLLYLFPKFIEMQELILLHAPPVLSISHY